MEKNRSSQIIAMIGLGIGIIGLSIGFAAFSKVLNIQSSANENQIIALRMLISQALKIK